jgi:hypothetical protein
VQGDAQLPEVLVAGEGLVRGAEFVLETLLHETAHGLAYVRKTKDMSRQGRYHNRRYQVLAEELGLDVAEAGAFGWSSTTIRDVTIKEYRRELLEHPQVLEHRGTQFLDSLHFIEGPDRVLPFLFAGGEGDGELQADHVAG